MQWFLALAIPILLTTCWLYTAHIARASFPRLRNKRICLLIAHPDDEAMFFAPTVLALTQEDLGNHVKILCFSNGNAENLGPIRKNELLSSTSILGLRSPSDVFVLEDPSFPDSMTTTWDSHKVSQVLESAFSSPAPPSAASTSKKQKQTKSTLQDQAPTATIDVLITFDREGVSAHKNHISLYHGATAWLKNMMKDKTGWECPVTLYTLTSVSILRKYISVLDAPFTMLQCVLQSMASAGSNGKDARNGTVETKAATAGNSPERLMYLSDVGAYRRAQKAMTHAHKSQMRWFRWGWIAVGRYMVVNDLKREKIS